ncbi:hypothetical protein F2Q70_00030786 [Brassica cretica]|uniref:DUF223 domain-containing protein n=1 Tax=Brassica cretica TaxID=69181 RepID=A0A8S9FLA2_BRACR|nr:hypothetical protein F2Q70_00030786 [Brassica cretica]
MAPKPNSKSIVSTGKSPVAMYFKDISPGPHESELRFRLIHFWEARNIAKAKTLIGLDLLVIDEQGTVMQGFIPASRVQQYLCDLKPGTIYKLFNSFEGRAGLTGIIGIKGSSHTRIWKPKCTLCVIPKDRDVKISYTS